MYAAGAFQVPFPFQPYPLQLHAMGAIRGGLEAGDVVVLESPTGTGKTQVLLNSVLSHVFEPVITKSNDEKKQQPLSYKAPVGSKAERACRSSRKRGLWRMKNGCPPSRKGKERTDKKDLLDTMDLFLLEQENHADARERQQSLLEMSSSSSSSSSATTTTARLDPLTAFSSDDDNDDLNMCVLRKPKVYFSSRTHTQLQQLTEELRRTVFTQHQIRPRSCFHRPRVIIGGEEEQLEQEGKMGDSSDILPHKLCFVHVAGRQQLCLNAQVKAAAGDNNERLNELCLEAMKYEYSKEGRGVRQRREGENKTLSLPDMEDSFLFAEGNKGCSYCRRERLKILRDYVDIAPRGLSEMRELGERVGACPFLCTRELLRKADVVLIPYTYLVSAEMREALLSGMATNEYPVETGGMKRCVKEKKCHDDMGHSARSGTRIASRSLPLLPPDFSGDVIVVDEAHNLVDYCRSATTASITRAELFLVRELFDAYLVRFEGKLLTCNKQRIREIVSFLDRFVRYMHMAEEKISQSAEVHSLSSFLFDADIDSVNVYCFLNFLKESRLLPKLQGLVAHLATRAEQEKVKGNSGLLRSTSMNDHFSPLLCDHRSVVSALHRFENFLRWYSRSDNDTRVLLQRLPGEKSNGVVGDLTVRLLQLEPGIHTLFPVLQQAQGAVLAGGTMKPIALTCDLLLRRPAHRSSDTSFNKKYQVYSNVSNDNNYDNNKGIDQSEEVQLPSEKNVRFVEEGHVVPSSSVAVFALGVGPSGRRVELQFSTRSQWQSQFEDVGAALLNFSRVVPAGMIVFFTSYEMQELFLTFLHNSGLYDTINSIKRIFCEASRTAASIGFGSSIASNGAKSSSSVETMLEEYAAWIRAGRSGGALLLAVIGGKLSEGINFNDDLGRAVVVLGLPYANPGDVELQLHLNHIRNTRLLNTSTSVSSSYPSPASTRANTTTMRDANLPFSSPEEWGLFTDLCMRAVNQSIGRCIRHASDYAVVILLDARYVGRSEVRGRIATWMQPSLRVAHSFGECFRGVRNFFSSGPPAVPEK